MSDFSNPIDSQLQSGTESFFNAGNGHFSPDQNSMNGMVDHQGINNTGFNSSNPDHVVFHSDLVTIANTPLPVTIVPGRTPDYSGTAGGGEDQQGNIFLGGEMSGPSNDNGSGDGDDN